MAWIFSLSAECGSKKNATQLAQHFANLDLLSEVEIEIFQDLEGHWWSMVMPSELRNSSMTQEMI